MLYRDSTRTDGEYVMEHGKVVILSCTCEIKA